MCREGGIACSFDSAAIADTNNHHETQVMTVLAMVQMVVTIALVMVTAATRLH